MTYKLTIASILLCVMAIPEQVIAQEPVELRGDPAAIADARAMVEAMGGAAIWRDLESVHFVHEWDVVNRPDRYLENEILDLTGPRSWVTMESEIYSRVRAYSPEHHYWSLTNGEFARGSDESLANATERAPDQIKIGGACKDMATRSGLVQVVPRHANNDLLVYRTSNNSPCAECDPEAVVAVNR